MEKGTSKHEDRQSLRIAQRQDGRALRFVGDGRGPRFLGKGANRGNLCSSRKLPTEQVIRKGTPRSVLPAETAIPAMRLAIGHLFPRPARSDANSPRSADMRSLSWTLLLLTLPCLAAAARAGEVIASSSA